MRTSFALMACVTIAMGGIGRGGELHVSPAGDDGHPGTVERPLRTLEAARGGSGGSGPRPTDQSR